MTGKERDAESGLDYFGARYYASNMGRWMSPDWADKPEAVPYSSLGNPQSLNLYGYVLNNPLSHADADGHCCDWSALGDYAVGVLRGGVSSLTYGYAGAPSSSDSASSLAGQFLGTSIVAGVGSSAVSGSGPAAIAGLATAPETAGASLVVSGGAVAVGAMGASAVTGAAGNAGAIANIVAMSGNGGRSGNDVKPDPDANGAHSVRKTDSNGNVTGGYTTFNDKGGEVKRLDVTGGSHGGVNTPHVHELKPGKGPGAPLRNVRPAQPDELQK